MFNFNKFLNIYDDLTIDIKKFKNIYNFYNYYIKNYSIINKIFSNKLFYKIYPNFDYKLFINVYLDILNKNNVNINNKIDVLNFYHNNNDLICNINNFYEKYKNIDIYFIKQIYNFENIYVTIKEVINGNIYLVF